MSSGTFILPAHLQALPQRLARGGLGQVHAAGLAAASRRWSLGGISGLDVEVEVLCQCSTHRLHSSSFLGLPAYG